MTRFLSRILSRFIHPSDAASVVSRHGARARQMTIQQRREAVNAGLRAYVAKRQAEAAQ